MGALFFDRRAQDIIENPIPLPQAFILLQNYPNPFNNSTVIEFTLPEAAEVRFRFFDILGRLMFELDKGWIDAGTYRQRLELKDFPSGVYSYMLTTGNLRISRKMTVVK